MPPLDVSIEQFRSFAEQVTKTATEYLESIDSRPIAPKTSGPESIELFRGDLPEQGLREEAFYALNRIPEHCRVQNGRFFGYVLGSGEPIAALADLLASVLNQNVTAWRSSPAAVIIETTVVGWLAQAIGCPKFQGS